MRKVTIFIFLSLVCIELGGCSWPVGAEHPHQLVMNRSENLNPRVQPTLRSEWRRVLGLQGPFTTSQGFIGGMAVHDSHPIVAVVGYDRALMIFNRVSGQLLWKVTLKSAGVGSPQFVGDLLYIPTGDGLLTAYHIKERAIKWKRQFSGLIRAPITFGKDLMYVCDGTNSLYALQQSTGEVVWQNRQETPKKFSLQGLI